MAIATLRKEDINSFDVEQLWQRFKADYFFRHTHQQIAWHSHHIVNHQDSTIPLVLVSKNATRGGTEVFVYSKDQHALFARVVAELNRRNLNVHDAQVMTSKDGFILDTFMVLDNKGKALEPNRQQSIVKSITKALTESKSLKIKARRAPKNLQHFKVKTRAEFLPTKHQKNSLLEFIALDTPGLLAKIGATFSELGIHLHAAKITTIGERAEDLFIITGQNKGKLSEQEEIKLKEALLKQFKISE
jgi:[protein-PII] uridylyltransferase